MLVSKVISRRAIAVAGIAMVSLCVPALAQNATQTRLFSAPNPALVGQSVMLTAEVDAFGGGAPTGQVTFNQGVNQLGLATLSTAGAGQVILSAGEYHNCALTSAGGVKCWGANTYGQLGDNTTDNHLIPKPVPKLSSGVVAVSAGPDRTCAVTAAVGQNAGATIPMVCWARGLGAVVIRSPRTLLI